MNAWFYGNLVDDLKKKKNDDGGLFWKWKRHGWMPLVWNMNSWVLKKKTWFDQFLKTMMQVMIFENKWVRHVGIPQFDLKKSFWVLNGPKKMSENAKSHGIAWVSDGGAKCHF